MSILLDSNNHEHFAGKTRSEINAIAGGKSPAAQENKQAAILAPLHELQAQQAKLEQDLRQVARDVLEEIHALAAQEGRSQ